MLSVVGVRTAFLFHLTTQGGNDPSFKENDEAIKNASALIYSTLIPKVADSLVHIFRDSSYVLGHVPQRSLSANRLYTQVRLPLSVISHSLKGRTLLQTFGLCQGPPSSTNRYELERPRNVARYIGRMHCPITEGPFIFI